MDAGKDIAAARDMAATAERKVLEAEERAKEAMAQLEAEKKAAAAKIAEVYRETQQRGVDVKDQPIGAMAIDHEAG